MVTEVSTMAPMFFGLIAAMLFGITTHAVYGTEGIMTQTWIDPVFWALISTGFVVSLIKQMAACLPCKLVKLAHATQLNNFFCNNAPCGK